MTDRCHFCGKRVETTDFYRVRNEFDEALGFVREMTFWYCSSECYGYDAPVPEPKTTKFVSIGATTLEVVDAVLVASRHEELDDETFLATFADEYTDEDRARDESEYEAHVRASDAADYDELRANEEAENYDEVIDYDYRDEDFFR
jgi:hypothetical protein